MLRVIHFTYGATDRLRTADALGASFVPLVDGRGETHVGCVHLDPGARVLAPSLTHDVALLVLHGRVMITNQHDAGLPLSGGMGYVFPKNEPYTLESEHGAILLIVECDSLTPQPRGVSTPDRIAGQIWPTDPPLTAD